MNAAGGLTTTFRNELKLIPAAGWAVAGLVLLMWFGMAAPLILREPQVEREEALGSGGGESPMPPPKQARWLRSSFESLRTSGKRRLPAMRVGEP